ncbi:glycine oxidase ThiO [Paenibacillus xylanexedens]|uniref:glycine oxidase ThiO n=1 Tax=Paenibacillus xylanexedens TaxID=528191 RepID=UPI0011A87A0F|nr:glycine oxidase ThiO [Paenibacillus xylanexedens]
MVNDGARVRRRSINRDLRKTLSRSRTNAGIHGKLHAETIVIGGGVIGCAIAYELAARGQDVLLLERARIAEGASCAAAGMIAADSEHFSSPMMANLATMSRQLLHEQCEQLSSLSGMHIGFQQIGFITPVRLEKDLNSDSTATAPRSITSEIWWDVIKAQQKAPWLSKNIYGAYYRPLECDVLPVNLTQAYAKSAQALGARIIEGVHHVNLRVDANGVQGVETSIGTMTCRNVIVANGLQGEVLMKQAGLQLPTMPVKGEIAAVQFSDHTGQLAPDKTVYADDIYIVPKANGEVWIGATVLQGESDLHVSAAGLQKLLERAASWVPGIAEAQFVRAWAGVRPSTPDGLPYLGACESMPGLYAAFGHHRNGILLSAVTGSLLADFIGGKSSEELNVQGCRPERFNKRGILH